tara:strand:+ start:49258 stop:50535 length:1278 start_codon:yes stop_codon:yes gene_type:complete
VESSRYFVADSDPINEAFQEGCRLKDQARKSRIGLEVYEQAAERFHTAGELSSQLAKNEEQAEPTKLQAELFAEYYLYEEQECLSTCFYERHDIGQAERCHNEGVAHLKTAIRLAEEAIPKVSEDCGDHLRGNIRVWTHYLHVNEIESSAFKAREAWDNGDLIRALDHYRLMLSRLPKLIEDASDPELDPVYKRIAIGNYFGMQVNASQALAQAYLNRAEGDVLPTDLAMMMLEQLFRAYQIGVVAFQANPEWDHYREDSGHVLKIIKDFLEDNKDKWLSIYVVFEDDAAFLSIMKDVDMERFKEVEAQRHIRESKAVKLWQIGAFFLLAFCVVFGAVFLLLQSFNLWWQVLLGLVGVEVLLLIIGAFTLRSVGDLSEKGFLDLIGIAFQQQFRVFNLLKKAGSKSTEQGGNAGESESGDTPKDT